MHNTWYKAKPLHNTWCANINIVRCRTSTVWLKHLTYDVQLFTTLHVCTAQHSKHNTQCTLQCIYSTCWCIHPTWMTTVMHLQVVGYSAHNSLCTTRVMCTQQLLCTTPMMRTQQRWCVHNSADGAQQHASVAARLRWRSELAWVRLTWGKAELSETKNSRRWPNWANLAGTEKCCWFQRSEVLEAKMSQGRVWQLTPLTNPGEPMLTIQPICVTFTCKGTHHQTYTWDTLLALFWISVTFKRRVLLDIFKIDTFRSEQPTSPIFPIMY